ncbi:uncharacterized protein LOC132698918 [Cylas formicarius]|uniref:uncharacterized protein LOC132698918 n=1 Tax=Cylas formicarius TaxID=197179 RepID=UPI0029589391|nr:uncharacterized protein LOC132698918 [Cylas formicarius]
MEISKLSIVKFFEMALSAICIGFHYRSRTNDFDCDTVSAVAFGGFIIISSGSFIGLLMNAPINRKVDTFYSLVGCAVFVAAGSLNIDFFEHFTRSEWKHYGIAKGILAIVNGAVFVLDSVLTWREGV